MTLVRLSANMKTTSFKDIKVFVVDDDLFYQNLIEQVLIKLGVQEIEKFESGITSLEKIHQKPDIVFLDYSMLHLNGLAFLKKMKTYDPKIYVIMLSAQEDLNIASEALDSGAFEYIQKGVDIEEKLTNVLAKVRHINSLLSGSKFNQKNK